MSDKPKATFLTTLGKHLVVGSEKLPTIEPIPPSEDAVAKAAADKAAADTAAAEKTAADKAASDKAAADKAAADKAEAEKAEADDARAKAAKAPLPPVEKTEFAEDPAPTTELKPVDTLLDYKPTKQEVRYLEVLQAGADREPEKYQAIFDREVDRLKKVNAFVSTWKADHPDEEFSPDSPDYRKFLRANPPAIDATEHEDLKDELRTERAKQAAKEELHKELEPKLRRVTELETRPLIEKAEADVEAAVLAALPESLADDDYLRTIAKEGGLEALTKVPEEGKVFHTAIERGRAVVSEFLKLRKGLVQFDRYNETHIFISRSVSTAAQIFEDQGGAERTRDGCRFVSPATYSKLKPEARKKHWTFDDQDIVATFAQMTAKGAIDELTERRNDRKAREDFVKSKVPAGKREPPAPAPVAPPPKSSPTVTPAPAAAATSPNPPKNPNLRKMMGITV